LSYLDGYIFENLLKFHNSGWRGMEGTAISEVGVWEKKMVPESWEKKMGERKEKSGNVLIHVIKKGEKTKNREMTIFIVF
jgi:hypothetical protein